MFKSFFKGLWEGLFTAAEKVKQAAKSVFVMAGIPVITIALDYMGFLAGGIFGGAVFSGIVLVISIGCVLLAMPALPRYKACRMVAKYGFWIDLVLTVVLTFAGFKMGAILGLTCMMMGLNLSAGMALIRLSAMLTDATFREEFNAEIRGGHGRKTGLALA